MTKTTKKAVKAIPKVPQLKDCDSCGDEAGAPLRDDEANLCCRCAADDARFASDNTADDFLDTLPKWASDAADRDQIVDMIQVAYEEALARIVAAAIVQGRLPRGSDA